MVEEEERGAGCWVWAGAGKVVSLFTSILAGGVAGGVHWDVWLAL